MERYFTTEWGEKVDIVDHTLRVLQEHPNMKIYIGTDSQDHGEDTVYATCIVYRYYGHRGAHYIYFKEVVPKIKDTYTRLFNEAVRTITTADIITAETPIKIETLEFDYNDVKKTKSTPLISAVRGWVTGLGYDSRFKGGGMIASKAADHIVRKK